MNNSGSNREPVSRILIGCVIGSLTTVLIIVACVVAFVFLVIIPNSNRTSADYGSPAAQQNPLPDSASSLPQGDADRGRQLFTSMPCASCHSLNEGEVKVGPPAYGMWARAGTRKPGVSAKDYLYESIVAPNAYIVPGFNSDVMPGNFGRRLTLQEIADILTFMERDLNRE